MTGGVLGGGVIFVVAAVLWAAVLVPAWMRRREFKAAEQNAVRLQRTLRVLAETAEVPTEVRVEATAREALAQEKLLRTAQRRQESERQAKLAAAKAEQVRAELQAQQAERAQKNLKRAARLRRPWVRRVRAVIAVLAVVAAIGIIVGLTLLIAGQGALVLMVSGLAFLTVSAGLVLMAPGRVKLIEIPAEVAAPKAAAPAVAQTEAPAAITEKRDTAAEHAANQAAAAERIARARALARARAERIPAGELVAQPGSMLRTREAQSSEQREGTSKRVANEQAAVVAAAPGKVNPGAAKSGEASASSGDTAAAASGRAEARPVTAAERAHSAIERSLQKASGADNGPARNDADALAARLRTMGVVEDLDDGKFELDRALRRQRKVS